jgi:hypothetical protein
MHIALDSTLAPAPGTIYIDSNRSIDFAVARIPESLYRVRNSFFADVTIGVATKAPSIRGAYLCIGLRL